LVAATGWNSFLVYINKLDFQHDGADLLALNALCSPNMILEGIDRLQKSGYLINQEHTAVVLPVAKSRADMFNSFNYRGYQLLPEGTNVA
jgi:hypothetical protein